MTDHLAVRTFERWNSALLARDFEALDAILADDLVFEDRRVGMRTVLDKAGNLAQARVMAEIGAESDNEGADLEVIETRGERCALGKITYRASDFTISILALSQVGPDGLVRAFIVFDVDDLDAARAELDARAGVVDEGVE